MNKVRNHFLFFIVIFLAFLYDPVGLGIAVKKMLDPLAIVPMWIMATRIFDYKKFIKWSLFLIVPLVMFSGYIQQLAEGVFSFENIFYKAVSLYFLFSVFNFFYLIYTSNKDTPVTDVSPQEDNTGFQNTNSGKNKKYKKHADTIGSALHKQIFDAMKENEKLASKRIESPFCAGYINNFMRAGFQAIDVPIDEAEDYFEYICDGVYPKKLNQLVLEQSLLAMNDETKKEEYNLGGEVAASDARQDFNSRLWNKVLDTETSDEHDLKLIPQPNLKKFLLKKKMTYSCIETFKEKNLEI